MQIKPATSADAAAIGSIVGPVARAGETYTMPRSYTDAEAAAYWMSAGRETFVAEVDGVVRGTYYLRANQPGGGGHVANAGYVTAAEATGRGIARAMCEHSLDAARARGFKAMQYNFVVSTNERAIRLWESLGFKVVGRLPQAFSHPTQGYVDALVLSRQL